VGTVTIWNTVYACVETFVAAAAAAAIIIIIIIIIII
jgi:hypothetical protein